jgi:hypothetical protein
MARRFSLAFEQSIRTSVDLRLRFPSTHHGSIIDGRLVNFNFDNPVLLADMRALYNQLLQIVSDFIDIPMRDYSQDIKDWNLRRRAEGLIEFRSCMWAAKTCISADLTIFRAIADGETPAGRTLRPRMEANSRFHNLGRGPTALPQLLSSFADPALTIPAAPTRNAPAIPEAASINSGGSDATTIQAVSFETGSSGSFGDDYIEGPLPPRKSSLAHKSETGITETTPPPTSPPQTPSLRREPRRIEDHIEEERKLQEMQKQVTPKKSFWKNPMKASKDTEDEGKKITPKKSMFFFRKKHDNDTDI